MTRDRIAISTAPPPLSEGEMRTVGMPTAGLAELPAKVDIDSTFVVEGRHQGDRFEYHYNPSTHRFAPVDRGLRLEGLTPVDRGHLRNLGSALRGAVDLIATTGNTRKLREQMNYAAENGVPLRRFNDEVASAGFVPVNFDPREDNVTPSHSPVSVAENAVSKAMTYAALYEGLGRPGQVMADDMGVFFAALDGYPGADFKPAAQEFTGLLRSRARGEDRSRAPLKYPYLSVLVAHIDSVLTELKRELGDVERAFKDRDPAIHYEGVIMRGIAAYLRANPTAPRDAFLFSCIAAKAPGEACEAHYGRVDITVETEPRGASEFPMDEWCSVNGTRITEMPCDPLERPSARRLAMMSLLSTKRESEGI
ncbi:MAG: non-canonical purine NTP pyrophosphatase [Myxococcota bacterium]